MKSAKSPRLSGGRLPVPAAAQSRRRVDSDDELQAGALGMGGYVVGIAAGERVVPLISALFSVRSWPRTGKP